MDLSRVEFLNSSEEINKRPDEYWTLVMDIARKNNLKRIVRYSQSAAVNSKATIRRKQGYVAQQCPARQVVQVQATYEETYQRGLHFACVRGSKPD